MPTFLGGRASVTKRSFPVLPKTADVIVIGAGAGGAAAAWALARKDVKVILIDAGPSYNTSEYKVADDDWELGGFLGKPGYQGQYEIIAGQPFDPARVRLRNQLAPRRRVSSRTSRGVGKYLHVRGIGGTTLHFTGWMHRLHPRSFQMNTLFGVAADWPVSYAESSHITCWQNRWSAWLVLILFRVGLAVLRCLCLRISRRCYPRL